MTRLLLAMLIVLVAGRAAAGGPTALETRLAVLLTDPQLFDLQAEAFESRFAFRGPITTAEKSDRSWNFDIATPDGFTGGKAFFSRRPQGAAGYRLAQIYLFFSIDDGISAERLQKVLEAKFGPAFISAPPGSNATMTWRWSSLRLIKITADVAGTTDPLVFGVEIARAD